MTMRKVEIERFSVTSSKQLEAVVQALKAAVRRPDTVQFVKAMNSPWASADAGR